MAVSQTVFLSSPAVGVGLITLDRPDRLNALNLAVKQEIINGLQTFEADPEITAIIFTGSKKVFIAGSDLSEMVDMSGKDHEERGTNDFWQAIRACKKIMIAAVEGYALGGGCEMALNCDVVFAAEDAKFGQPEIRVGIMAGAGGTQILTRAMGKHRAMKLLLSCEQFSAQDAYDFGVVSELTPSGEALSKALAFATTLTKFPPKSVALTKQAVMASQNLTLAEGLLKEREYFLTLCGSHDQKEGMTAFLEKRAPVFNGR